MVRKLHLNKAGLGAFPGGPVVKNLSANAGATGDSDSMQGQADPLEKEMATHASVLA